MKKIKFRAKCVVDNKWKYGGLIMADDYCIIDQQNELYEQKEYNFKGDTHLFEISGAMCDETTVGQFIGLLDKNGKEIYEGDVVKKTCISGYVGMFYIGEVVFKDGSFLIDTHDKYKSLRYTNFDYECEWNDGHCHGIDQYEFEVIGNIYDNNNLIKNK